MTLLTVILLLVLSDACICSHDESSDESSVEKELTEFLSDFSDAFKVPECATSENPDCSAVAAFSARDAILAPQGVPTAFGRAEIKQFTEGFKALNPSAYSEITIKSIKADRRSATVFGITTTFVNGEIFMETRVLIYFINEADEEGDSVWKIQYLLDNEHFFQK
ncbi:unnamed protein product [Owenia fusiformis]|uniref:Uncharacterized protein n=1 Tax=Owenia fusiformis TaxID=6347 RepID=A0A8S4Q1R2_OWEFU|nr:unnamed protein product [Owenia fusiformis]